MSGDNFEVRVASDKKPQFMATFALFSSESKSVVGYRVSTKHGLILYRAIPSHQKPEDPRFVLALPYEMDLEQAAEFSWGWLQKAEYPKTPDIDGDCVRGWLIFNEAYGHIDGQWEAFMAVKPDWQMYGK